MARIVGLRRPRPIPEVEAEIARLGEELTFTAAFVSVAGRRGEQRLALGVLDEQRARIVHSKHRMLKELGKPRSFKVHAALAGAAAVMMLGSASFAGYRALVPPANEHVLHSASARLEAAASSTDANEVIEIVGQVHSQLSALAKEALQKPAVQHGIQELLQRELLLLQQAGVAGVSQLERQIRSLASQANVTLPKSEPKPASPPPPPNPEKQKQSPPAAPTP